MIRRLALVILATASTCSATASRAGIGMGCGQPNTSGKRLVPLASMRIQVPLYVMEANGRLMKMDLSSGATTSLSDHAFNLATSLHPSGDGRWLGYKGEPKGANTTQYWLYDRHDHKERLIYEHPPYGSDIPSFSPDSRYFVISAWYDSRWADANRAGIYLFDTTALRLQRVPLPLVDTHKAVLISTTWSQDGKELLILVRTEWTKDGFAYFSYHLPTQRIETIAGRYNTQMYRHEFWRGAQQIPEFKKILPRSALAERSAWSTERSWRAYIDERANDPTYPLLVMNTHGATRTVARGHFEQCAGDTLFITGWLDDRHLVYRNEMNYFIFDTLTGSTAKLLSEEGMPVTFTW